MKPRLANISSRGLTLIELLLVLAMIGLLVVVILPATQAVRESARRAQCASHLKQMGVALHLYHEQMQSLPIGLLPVYDSRYSRQSPRCTPDFLDRSFLVALLPHLEQNTLFASINADLAISSRENRSALTSTIGVYFCPSDTASGRVRNYDASELIPFGQAEPDERIESSFTSYLALHGTFPVVALPLEQFQCRVDSRALAQADGCFIHPTSMPISRIRDGLDSTIFVVERATQHLSIFKSTVFDLHGLYWCGNWGDTVGSTFVPPNVWKRSKLPTPIMIGASSMHPGGVHTLFGDGSVRFVKDSIQSWPFNDRLGLPTGVSPEPEGWWSGIGRLGVWQALGTRAGGEVISASDLP